MTSSKQSLPADHVDVLIIGAGPGGLASAMLLAHAGLRVRIIERNTYIGGRTSCFEAKGFRFDLGPTFFHLPEYLERIFACVGRRMSDELEMVRLDPSYRVLFGSSGQDLVIAPDIEKMRQAIAEIAPEDAKHLDAYMEENKIKWDILRPLFMRPQNSWRDWLPTVVKNAFTLRPWNTMDEDHSRHFKDEKIRRAFSFQSKYLGMSAFECPAALSFHSAIELEPGIYHPIGGCGAITEAMARVVRELGVEISLGDEVQGILFEGKKAVGVKTSRGETRADAIFINADFAHAMSKLVPNELRKKWSDEKMEKKRYSCSTFMMYLGIEGLEEQLAHHTVFLPDDYHRNTQDIEVDHVLSDDPSFYVQNACVTDPGLAPKGMSTLYTFAPVTHQHPNVDWSRERERYRGVLLSQLARIGIKDLERRIRFERIITPDDWSGQHAVHKGAVFNLAHNVGQMVSNRPKNTFDELEQVYLVGGGTHPGSGLFTIFNSAKISVEALLQKRGMKTSWMNQLSPDSPPVVLPARVDAA